MHTGLPTAEMQKWQKLKTAKKAGGRFDTPRTRMERFLCATAAEGSAKIPQDLSICNDTKRSGFHTKWIVANYEWKKEWYNLL